MTAFTRTPFGELVGQNEQVRAILSQAKALASQAAAKRKIPTAHDGMQWERINSRIGNKKIGSALHHEIYDLSADGRHVLLCCRSVEGSKYGIKTTSKQYFILHKHGTGVRVEEANKNIAAKAAKQAGDGIGLALDILAGKAKLTSNAEIRKGFKIVTRDDMGNLVSVWDGSAWPIGKRRGEKATDTHDGGFYYYRTVEQAIEAARCKGVFQPAMHEQLLVLLEVEASGTEYSLSDGKLCTTYLKPLAVVAEPIL
ncbi:hypothetical protein QU487_06450 [Crenobacter sp. SG2305]|uniref:hypothetical protein n=1 Tax=Crenobacter oryzisoli TaxID=3056844 RepID=UPI0025AAE7CE|nr:hypothetical protein [Crenobacter sp. SG2305]MDN0082393.1 hypothetical protein [Crenobacter sp. SG2305]